MFEGTKAYCKSKFHLQISNFFFSTSGFLSFFLSFKHGTYGTRAGVPDEAGGYEAFYGFSGDFMEFHIPVVIWHIENMQLHKLSAQQKHTFQWLTKSLYVCALIVCSYLAACRSCVLRKSQRVPGQIHHWPTSGAVRALRTRGVAEEEPGTLWFNSIQHVTLTET